MSSAAKLLLERVARRRLVVVTGKGGVGKTIVSVMLGRLLADAGLRALVVEVDPRENAHQMLGIAPSGGEIVNAGGRLSLQSLKPRDVLDRLVREQVRIEMLARRVLASPVYQHFAEGAPGLKELAVFGHALDAANRGRADVVILDAPATGHGLALLRAPIVVSEVIEHGPIGKMARELATFAADRERCSVVVVTTAEEMPVQESLELLAALETDLGRTPDGILVNALYPELTAADQAGAAAADPLLELWRARRAVNELELANLHDRVAEGVPIVTLPFVATQRGPALVATLVEAMRSA
jgi:anion-transporting  ArsA/GET3 family ATPase